MVVVRSTDGRRAERRVAGVAAAVVPARRAANVDVLRAVLVD
jgi:hypothetical protein